MNIHFGTKSPIRTPRQVVLGLDPQRVLSHSLEAEPWLGDTITHLRRANSLCWGIGSAVGRRHSDDSLAMPLVSLLVHTLMLAGHSHKPLCQPQVWRWERKRDKVFPATPLDTQTRNKSPFAGLCQAPQCQSLMKTFAITMVIL